MANQFVLEDAIRGALPTSIALAGPSRSGKTFSALRLATGIQRVCGGDIALIDTESKRSLHYAPAQGEPPRFGTFKFRRLQFGAPFCPSRYQAAVEHCVNAGAKTIIIDSMSHEHEGPGGLLEQHKAEVERLSQAWKMSESAVQLPAWAEPKAKRTSFMNRLQQLDINLLLCFRAKPKDKMLSKKEKAEIGTKESIIHQGWMYIGGSEYLYLMDVRCLLLPGAQGKPTWVAEDPGEKEWIGMEDQFKPIWLGKGERQIDEDHGEAMARWASAGTREPHPMDEKTAELVARYEAAQTAESVLEATDLVVANKKSFAPHQIERLTMAKRAAEARLGVNQGGKTS